MSCMSLCALSCSGDGDNSPSGVQTPDPSGVQTPDPSGVQTPEGFLCKCEQSGALKPINAPSVRQAETLCKKDGGKIKSCARNQ